MKFIYKYIRDRNFIALVLVIILGIIASRELIFLPGYFNMHDDLQLMRQLEMEKCFRDLQIPCRWVPDMGYGFGFPLFNFYPPLPYLVGQGIRLLGLSFITTVKLTFSLSIIFSGIAMYLLARELFGSRIQAVVSSAFYIWAPYHAVDVYVRGAMNEAWALVWFPLILLFSLKLISGKGGNIKKWLLLLSLSWFGLFMSHNLMVMIFAPVFAVWCLFYLWKEKRWDRIPALAVSGILILGLSAFFTIPAMVEQSYVQVNTLISGYYEYIAHFATLNQILISRFWGYGPSVWGPNDGMSFQVGHLHWILSLIILAILVMRFIKTKKLDKKSIIVVFFIAVGWFAAFMTHSRSTFIWMRIPPLKFVQFPWRFLTISILAFSLVSGYFLEAIKSRKYKIGTAVLLVLLLVILDWNYFKPEKMGPLTDTQKFTGAAWELQQTAGIYDYLPKEAYEAPKHPQSQLAEILNGKARVTNPLQGTNWGKFDIKVDTDSAKVRLGIFRFPNWVTSVDGVTVVNYVAKYLFLF